MTAAEQPEVKDLRLPPAAEVVGGYFWSLAFDPGVSTGWCVYRVPRLKLLSDGFLACMRGGGGGAWNSGEFTGDDEWSVNAMLAITRAVYAEVDEEAGDEWAVLVEDFIVRMIDMKRSFLSPVRLSAAYRWEMRRAPVFIDQKLSSDAMNIVTDGRLRDWNMYRPGSVHARDAQRHAIMMCRRYSSEPAFREVIRAKMG